MRHLQLLPILAACTAVFAACGDKNISDAECVSLCATVPAPSCADDATLKRVTPSGTCSDGACDLTEVYVNCPDGCAVVDGVAACVSEACAGVVCDTPPSACHAPVGLCSDGVCDYAVLDGLPCDDGDACTTDDACDAAAACRGEALACQTPAPSVCDGDTLKVSSSAGTCVDGSCTYATTDVVCDDGCADGACLGDPCAGKTCDTAPGVCYDSAGTCRDGVCDYAYDNGATCDDGDACTDADRCDNGSCRGTSRVCATPPAAVCKDNGTLTRYAAAGTCSGGNCNYVPTDVACEFGCETREGGAACAGDPCGFVTCNTPPVAACQDAGTLVVPAASGTCAAGECEYASTTVACTRGCEAGVGGAPAVCKAPTGLVIAEVLYDSPSNPDTESFVELAGPAGTDLSGLELVGINGNGGALYNRIALTGTIGESGRFVVAHPQAAESTVGIADMLDSKVDYQNGPDSIQLRFGSQILDAVAYGTFPNGTVEAGEGDPAPATAVGVSLSRDRNDTDTDDNLTDFRVGAATPGTAAFWPEAAPEVSVACPASGHPDETLTFAASATAGTVASWRFDFGDGSAPVTGAGGTTTHAFAAVGSYTVTVTGSTAGGQSDTATCSVVIDAAEEVVSHSSEEQCFASGVTYREFVISNPVAAMTNGKLVVRYKGLSTYGVGRYTIRLQTGPSDWATVAVTNESKEGWQIQNFVIDQGDLTTAMNTMGWLRFQWSSLTSGATSNCVQLTLNYNCTECFECPPGEQDLGIACQPVDQPYDYTLGEHPRGYCASNNKELYFPGTPTAAGDGVLTLQSLGCGNASVRARIYTQNSGWVDIGSGSGGNCYFSGSSWTVPEAFLAAAVDAENRIRVSWYMTDTCAAGTGCSSYSDPCLRNVKLTFPRQ